MVVLYYKGDTVELNKIFSLPGNSARRSCLWCKLVSVLGPDRKYAPAALDAEDSKRGDLHLHGVNNDAPDLYRPEMRSWAHHLKYGSRVDNLRASGRPTAADNTRTKHGVSGLPLFSKLRSFAAGYPWVIALDRMHVWNQNFFRRMLDLVFRWGSDEEAEVESDMVINRQSRSTISSLQDQSRTLIPTQILETLRNYSEKHADMQAWEIDALMTQQLYYLVRGVAPDPVCALVRQATIVARLTCMKIVSLNDPDDAELELESVPLDGKERVSAAGSPSGRHLRATLLQPRPKPAYGRHHSYRPPRASRGQVPGPVGAG